MLDNNYDRALALQRYFRSGEFEYSETAPVADDYDGNGLSVIAEFLQRKAGYCVHFSSAMAVMARTLGHPVAHRRGLCAGLARADSTTGAVGTPSSPTICTPGPSCTSRGWAG